VGYLLALLVLCLLVFVHELGHFLIAKILGIGVIRFSIGFGPVIASKKIGKTEYALSLVPLGGYVKMEGEDASVIEGDSVIHAFTPEASFELRPIWQKFLTIFAGPGFNILFAALCYMLLFGVYGISEPTNVVVAGLNATWVDSKLILLGLWKMVTGSISSKELGGPILIVQATGSIFARSGFAGLLEFTAFLSVNLGVLNLLPIPVLDGGHLFIFLLEGMTGRKVSPRAKKIAQKIGLTLLIALMLFATWNDILRLVTG